MAKPTLIVHVHAEETRSPLSERVREALGERLDRRAAPPEPPRSMPSLLRFANALGTPILLSMSNERLWRALSDPAERKALSDGVSRARVIPAPAPAFSTVTGLLSPADVADELRLNIDLWTMAFITPSFGIVDRSVSRVSISSADPAGFLDENPRPQGVLELEWTAVESAPDRDTALQRLAERLRGHTEFQLVRAAAGSRSDIDALLRRILTSGERFPTFGSALLEFDPVTDGFPMSLASALQTGHLGTRALAPHGRALLEHGFDPAKLETALARGLVTRALYRSRLGVPPIRQAVESFTAGLYLLSSVAADAARAVSSKFLSAPEMKSVLERWVARAGGWDTIGKAGSRAAGALEPTGSSAAPSIESLIEATEAAISCLEQIEGIAGGSQATDVRGGSATRALNTAGN